MARAACVSPSSSAATASAPSRSYKDALDALNSLQTPHHVLQERRRLGKKAQDSYIKEQRVYLRRLGYAPADLDRLNVVHVAGTKGKGSTCAFVESILSQYRLSLGRPRKTGMLVSPHLIAVRERIRIDSAPLSEEAFACYFFEVWDRLGSSRLDPDLVDLGSRPPYARFISLLSWHVFMRQGVDVVVCETGIGGEYDSTNVIERPAVTGISTLGIDHVQTLGDTVEKIAWHKAGIMKAGSPAFTVEQPTGALDVLKSRALEKGVVLGVLSLDPRLDSARIRPNAKFQKKNATLAVALARVALHRLGIPDADSPALPPLFVRGLETVEFRGRCEVKQEGRLTWHLDGAHNTDSLKMSSRWFAEETAELSGPRILIFNQQGREEAVQFLDIIHGALRRPGQQHALDHVVFCTNVTYSSTGYARDFVNHGFDPKQIQNMTMQRRFADKWSSLDPGADVRVMPTIEDAVAFARRLGDGLLGGEKLQVFVTGSLHLVGGVLGVLEGADAL